MGAFLAAACCLVASHAATLVVGQGGDKPATFAEAVQMAEDGDTIAVLPGEYRRDAAVITQKRLTIRGIGARPVFVADGSIAEGKAIWVVRDGEVTVENIEFRDARAPDLNGAGIRFEQGRLTVRRCAFINNENGILTANFGDAELLIEDSEFAGAPPIDGRNHLLYVGRIAKLTVRGSRFHRSALGHLIKSRARESMIAYNLIVDGPAGNASYEVDLPNGGVATLIGNVIAKGPRRDNPVVIAYGAEGSAWERSALLLSHNTLVNDGWRPAWFLRVWSDKIPAGTQVLALNNLSVGPGVFTLGAKGQFDGNWPAVRAILVDVDQLDFALDASSVLRGTGVDPAATSAALVPQFEFRMPVGTVPLAPPTKWTPGAFQR